MFAGLYGQSNKVIGFNSLNVLSKFLPGSSVAHYFVEDATLSLHRHVENKGEEYSSGKKALVQSSKYPCKFAFLQRYP